MEGNGIGMPPAVHRETVHYSAQPAVAKKPDGGYLLIFYLPDQTCVSFHFDPFVFNLFVGAIKKAQEAMMEVGPDE